jgi:phosphopantothenoylcysteine decarboxylase/phosphopantothenate--cysteine ligase
MRPIFEGREIVLGVCGGIAAYKSVEILRLLKGAGAAVRVIMTTNARWFVGPGTFETLSGRAVLGDLFAPGAEGAIRHIDWARDTGAVVIAPATANILAKLAGGLADDALSTFMLAVTAPALLCPAMNSDMYRHPAVQRNLETLRGLGYHLLDPDSGPLACGTYGPGRQPDAALIVDRLQALLTPKDLAGRSLLVTAGPTEEPIDAVRFVSNPSSGRMGYALARAAEHRGARVVLVSGPTALTPPVNVETLPVRTAAEMRAAVLERLGRAEIVIKAAAVSDFRPVAAAAHKIKKDEAPLTLSFERTADILLEIGACKGDRLLVGFAAETEALERYAQRKLVEKNLDLVVGNLVGRPGSGFGAEENEVTLFHRDGGVEPLPAMTKEAVAHRILDRVAALLAARG